MGNLLIACLGIFFAPEPPPQVVEQAIERLYRSEGYQPVLPRRAAAERAADRFGTSGGEVRRRRAPSNRGESAGRNRGRYEEGGSSSGSAGDSSSSAALESLFWVIVIAGGLFLLALFLSRFRRREPKALSPAAATPEAVAPSAEELAAPRSAAQKLADAGRYDEAIHSLLLNTLGLLSARVPGGLPPALTSREILQGVTLPEGGRDALEALVAQVESALFAGRAPAEGDWDAAEAHFAAFTEACSRSRA